MNDYIKGIVFSSDKNITNNRFTDFYDEDVAKISDNIYVKWTHHLNHSDLENSVKYDKKYLFTIIKRDNGTIEMWNGSIPNELEFTKKDIRIKGTQYFKSIKDSKGANMNIKDFNKIKAKAKKHGKSFEDAYKMKDDINIEFIGVMFEFVEGHHPNITNNMNKVYSLDEMNRMLEKEDRIAYEENSKHGGGYDKCSFYGVFKINGERYKVMLLRRIDLGDGVRYGKNAITLTNNDIEKTKNAIKTNGLRYFGGLKKLDSIKAKDDIVSDFQKKVDIALKMYGRIGGGLYEELDDAGLWVDDRNNKYIVKRKTEDSCKDDDTIEFNEKDKDFFKRVLPQIRDLFLRQYKREPTEEEELAMRKLASAGVGMAKAFRVVAGKDSIKDDTIPASGGVSYYKKDENKVLSLVRKYGFNDFANHNNPNQYGLCYLWVVINGNKELFEKYKQLEKEVNKIKSNDSIKDVNPRAEESKADFIARFMNETKSEYPNEKQRYAVANSYWENKAKDSIKDATPQKPEFSAIGNWEWDESKFDWYDTGRRMYYNEIVKNSGSNLAKLDSIHDSMESEVRAWWDKVETWNQTDNKYHIDNFGASPREMLEAMFDMLIDLKRENPSLYQEGKKIYNRYSTYSKFNDGRAPTTTRSVFTKNDIDEKGSWLGSTEWGTRKGSLYIYKQGDKIIAEGNSDYDNDFQFKGKKEFNSLYALNQWLNDGNLKDSIHDYYEYKSKVNTKGLNETVLQAIDKANMTRVELEKWLEKVQDKYGIDLAKDKDKYIAYNNAVGMERIMNRDSIHDEDIESLSKEEQQAIDDYKKAISGTNDVKLLELYSHILREEIEHLRELNEVKGTDSIKDGYKYEIISKVWYPEDFNNPSSKTWWDDHWKEGLRLQQSNRTKFLTWVNETIQYAKDDLKDGYIKNEVLDELIKIKVNPNLKDSVKDEETIRYKEYYIYKFGNQYRAIRRDKSTFDFTGKTIEEVKAKIDNVVKDSINDDEIKVINGYHIPPKDKFDKTLPKGNKTYYVKQDMDGYGDKWVMFYDKDEDKTYINTKYVALNEIKDSKARDLILGQYVQPIANILSNYRSDIIQYGKNLVKKGGYQKFDVRFINDICKYTRIGKEVEKIMGDDFYNANDSYRTSLFRDAFRKAGISFDESAYK